MKTTTSFIPFALALLLLAACNRTQPVVQFEPNTVYAQVSELSIGYSMQQALAEAQVALTEHFGNPDHPKLPKFLEGDAAKLVDLQRITAASGATDEPGRGLFRKHCASCHGVTGNGRGINATQGDVYPRDFRMGRFKFKSTSRGSKPLRSDLFTTIRNGIAGTSMARINELSDSNIETLVDYVIYLSWRGEVERKLLAAGEEIEFESEDGEALRNLYAPSTNLFEEQQVAMVKGTVADVADDWLSAQERIKEVPSSGDIPSQATLEELISAAQASQLSPLKDSIERGRQLFISEKALCSKCHGVLGHGDGQNQDYDDWTKDWTGRLNLDLADENALLPLLARGALPPRRILPRDLREGIYRGGSPPDRLYHRIAYGIDGTPMPAAEGVLPAEDIWHLVNYVRSLATPSPPEPSSSTSLPKANLQ